MSHDLVVNGIMEELSKSTNKSDFDKSDLVKKVEKVWGLIWDVGKKKISGPVGMLARSSGYLLVTESFIK